MSKEDMEKQDDQKYNLIIFGKWKESWRSCGHLTTRLPAGASHLGTKKQNEAKLCMAPGQRGLNCWECSSRAAVARGSRVVVLLPVGYACVWNSLEAKLVWAEVFIVSVRVWLHCFPVHLFPYFYLLAMFIAYGSTQARDGSCATAVTKAAAVTTWILSPLHHKRTPLAQFLNRSVPLQ